MHAQEQFGRNVRLTGARIVGVVSALPSLKITNDHFVPRFGAGPVADIVKMIGVQSRYWADKHVTTADLCLQAAQVLLEKLGWPREEIGALVYVTQTPDHRLPATACILQNRLGLPAACAAFDINLGCSGYPYGLWVAMSLLLAGRMGRVLLLVGDTVSKIVDPSDRSTALLFGDAGTATAVEATDEGDVAQFVLGTDGSGSGNLIIPSGGCRPASQTDPRLATRDLGALFMDGGEIFNFTLRGVPGLVKQAIEQSGTDGAQIDAYLFHQANLFMLNHLARKLKIPGDRFPTNIDRFGNTSSASIPLLLTSDLAEQLRARALTVAMAGFGVGYSWAAAVMPLGPLACVETIGI